MQKSSNTDVANQFIQFLKSTSSQVVFGQNGFRPVNPAAAKQFTTFPVRPGQITLADKTLGGYAAAEKKWFTPPHGVMYGVESAVGGPSS
jgi:ABC-type sulfate transport system substrate-binding protein